MLISMSVSSGNPRRKALSRNSVLNAIICQTLKFHINLKLMSGIPITLIEYCFTMVRRTHTIGVVL